MQKDKIELHKKCRSKIKYVGNDYNLKPYCPHCRKQVLKSEIKLVKIIDRH
jgi:hypothetical protein